jgi:hypothetical protein
MRQYALFDVCGRTGAGVTTATIHHQQQPPPLINATTTIPTTRQQHHRHQPIPKPTNLVFWAKLQKKAPTPLYQAKN